jgi:hypothetical protein
MNLSLRTITNHYQDARLNSLSKWRQASEITPRDRNGPYVITQEGYDPEDASMIADEFILSRSGKWLSLGYFYQLPVDARREEFVFGTATEAIQLMNSLPSKVQMMRPAGEKGGPSADDDMAAALNAGKNKAGGEKPK